MKQIRFSGPVWDDYLHLQHTDPQLSARLDQLLDACARTPFEGVGKPCPLKSPLTGWWSRRLTHIHRLVYCVRGNEVLVAQCLYRP